MMTESFADAGRSRISDLAAAVRNEKPPEQAVIVLREKSRAFTNLGRAHYRARLEKLRARRKAELARQQALEEKQRQKQQLREYARRQARDEFERRLEERWERADKETPFLLDCEKMYKLIAKGGALPRIPSGIRYGTRDGRLIPGTYFGIQDGELVVTAATEAEVMNALDHDRHYLSGYVRGGIPHEELQVPAYRQKAWDAFRLSLNSSQAVTFWRIAVREMHAKTRAGKPLQLSDMLSDAFVLPYLASEPSYEVTPEIYSVLAPDAFDSDMRTIVHNALSDAFRAMLQRARDYIPLLDSVEMMSRWIKNALRLYAVQHATGQLGQRASDADLDIENYYEDDDDAYYEEISIEMPSSFG